MAALEVAKMERRRKLFEDISRKMALENEEEEEEEEEEDEDELLPSKTNGLVGVRIRFACWTLVGFFLLFLFFFFLFFVFFCFFFVFF